MLFWCGAATLISEGGQEWYPPVGGRVSIFVEAAHLLHSVVVAVSSPAKVRVSYRIDDVVKNTCLSMMHAHSGVLGSSLAAEGKTAYQNEMVGVGTRCCTVCTVVPVWGELFRCVCPCVLTAG